MSSLHDRIYQCWLEERTVYKTQDILRLEGFGMVSPKMIHNFFAEWEADDDPDTHQDCNT